MFYGKIENKKLVLDSPAQFNKKIEELDGKRVAVSLEQKRKNRSLEQNAYYWGVVLASISDFTGYDAEDLHNHFKAHFLKREVGNLTTFKSTSHLNTKEFTDYIDKIIRFANQVLGIEIPTPEQAGYYEANPGENQETNQ